MRFREWKPEFGREWLAAQRRPVSEFGGRVAEIVNALYDGIYHIHPEALRTDWSRDDYVQLTVVSEANWATFDGARLTMLVVLCHDRAIRCQIHASTNRYFRLAFSPRKHGSELGTFGGHPTMEQQIRDIREAFPAQEVAEGASA